MDAPVVDHAVLGEGAVAVVSRIRRDDLAHAVAVGLASVLGTQLHGAKVYTSICGATDGCRGVVPPRLVRRDAALGNADRHDRGTISVVVAAKLVLELPLAQANLGITGRERLLSGDGAASDQVVLDLHVGELVTALHVEEVHGVGGVVGEGVAVAVPRDRALAAGSPIEVPQGVGSRMALGANVADLHHTCAEVDVEGRHAVDATEVSHEDAVDVDPHVIVARELEGQGLERPIGFLDHAAVGLREGRGHGDAEVVVVVVARLAVHLVAFAVVLRGDGRVERKEAVVCSFVSPVDVMARVVRKRGDREPSRVLVEHRPVVGTVVEVVAVFILLKKVGCSGVGRLAVLLVIWVEQVREGLAAVFCREDRVTV